MTKKTKKIHNTDFRNEEEKIKTNKTTPKPAPGTSCLRK